MPEGPEVRRYADALHQTLHNHELLRVSARTRAAKAWLLDNPEVFAGLRVQSVRAHGKNLIGRIEGGLWFYSHLMMWGRWQIAPREDAQDVDRRERARLETHDHAAILLSAPVFEVGRGDPYEQIETLAALGPDILPYPDEPPFNSQEFLRRLNSPEHRTREIGAALLDQTVCAGIGNYLRAEILYEIGLDPFRIACDLSEAELSRLCDEIPRMARRAYETGGATLPDAQRERVLSDATLRYSPSEWGARHWVFRRTNLPCLKCGTPIRQLRQTTRVFDDGEKSRIIFFCALCQNVTREAKKTNRKGAKAQREEEEKG